MEAYIYDFVRTPRGYAGREGSLREITPVALAATVLRALRDRNGLDTTLIDDVGFGCAHPVGEQGANIARSALLMADYDPSVPGVQMHRFGASGLEACIAAAALIACGSNKLAVAGGVESISRVPLLADGGAIHSDPAVATKIGYSPQGVGADLLATLWAITRQDLDTLAMLSHQKAMAAWDDGRFSTAIIPIVDQNGLEVLARDEAIRSDISIESLGQMEAMFKHAGETLGYDEICRLRYPQIEQINHLHHAGNSSVIADGAAAILIGSKEMGERLSIQPRAKFRAVASIGSDPTLMLAGQVPAAQRALRRAGLDIRDIDLFEVNEVFASVPLVFSEELDIATHKINVNGGSIAMGDPLGATGAILLGTLLNELERQNLGTGLVTLCAGAGMATAAIIERV
jgi:acetyl-CoA C-acetyltransferase